MSDFGALVGRFLDELFTLDPIIATAAGRHEHDAEWPDLSTDGRADWRAWLGRWAEELAAVPDRDLAVDERIDRDRLAASVAAWIFEDDELAPESWDPLHWAYVLGGGLFPLIARAAGTPEARFEALCGRLEGVPELLAAARARLTGTAGRPVSRLHAEKGIESVAGIAELARMGVSLVEEAAQTDPAVAPLAPRAWRAGAVAAAALEAFSVHLRDVVLPGAAGEGRLGPELYRRRLRHAIGDPEVTPARVLAEAERESRAVHVEMVRLADELWPTWCPGREHPEDETARVRTVLDAIAQDHSRADELLDVCRDALGRIEAFCRDRDVIGLVDEPLDIVWTPTFLRSVAGVMFDAPGPYDRGQKSFFFVTPCDAAWKAERTESYLREQNRRQLAIITIHETVPGHYLQSVYANRAPNVVRAVLGDGAYAEGWAVYVTQVMLDLGFAGDDRAIWLVHWKYFLRAAVNAILDVRIHTAGMTEAEALELMVGHAFQEEAEARAKWDRARLTSTQLSTYFVGSMLFWDLEREVRARRAREAGDPRGAAAVPESSLVGARGETPGFSYRAHLEAVISHGALPMPILRRAILGD